MRYVQRFAVLVCIAALFGPIDVQPSSLAAPAAPQQERLVVFESFMRLG